MPSRSPRPEIDAARKGGEVQFVPNPPAAARSRAATLQFFEQAFGVAQ